MYLREKISQAQGICNAIDQRDKLLQSYALKAALHTVKQKRRQSQFNEDQRYDELRRLE